ncbi:MAG: hypothetical protein WC554_06110 [Clostridia bacterium]|jgi:hypothetical protein
MEIDWSKYQETTKLVKVSPESLKLGAFLDWLQNQGIHLCKWEETHCSAGDPEDLVEIRTPKEKLLAQYFEIDLDKVEIEKRNLLEEIRNAKP